MPTRRPPVVSVRPGRKAGELEVALDSAWELRLRRILVTLLGEALPDPRAAGLTTAERQTRRRLRRQHLSAAICRFVGDLITAEIVGKEIALATRNRYGRRRGSLREHVSALLREMARG